MSPVVRPYSSKLHAQLLRRSAWVPAGLLVLGMLMTACSETGAVPDEQASTADRAAHAHDAAGETCFICDPSKRDPERLWCKEHGRYEDRCWECQPQLRDPNRPYCEEHGLYEDECFLCDPSRGDTTAASDEPVGGGQQDELFCNEHQVPEHECGICQPQRAGALPLGESLLVRLASARSAELAGLSIGKPARGETDTSIPLLGEIRFDGNRLARVTPLAGGVLAKVYAEVGQAVRAGEILAIVNAPGAAEAKAAYLSAEANLAMWQAASKRQRRLFEDKVGSRRALEEAEASYSRAQVASTLAGQRLLNLGFRESELKKIRDSRSALYLRAPFSGSIVSRSAVLGEAVDTKEALFEVADLSQMWVELSVPEEDAALIRTGTPIRVSVRALHNGARDGQITWVSPVVDERTRMVRARGALPNDDGVLRHGMFADVTAIIQTHADAVRLPASAVHRIENLPFVFVQTESDLFAARRVGVGERLPSDEFVIHEGILADDAVVMSGGFAIKSALLASRLGAGCTDD